MATCPNINLDSWKNLVATRGEDVAYYLWDKFDGNVPDSESRESIVKSGLKAVNALQSDKATQLFNTLAKNKVTGDTFWNKIQQDLGIPKDQVELLKSFDTTNREELVTNMLANYSFAIEINIAEDRIRDEYKRFSPVARIIDSADAASITGGEIGEYFVEYINSEGEPDVRIFKTKEEAENAVLKESTGRPSQYYSNLTVPGGTNYTKDMLSLLQTKVLDGLEVMRLVLLNKLCLFKIKKKILNLQEVNILRNIL
jgi:hypothetical protein